MPPEEFWTVRVQVCDAEVGEKLCVPFVPVSVPVARLPVHEYEGFPVAFVELQDSVELEPVVTDAGLKDAEHVGADPTLTEAVQVFVPPTPLSTLSVHVCEPVGLKLLVPVVPDNVPEPKFPVQE